MDITFTLDEEAYNEAIEAMASAYSYQESTTTDLEGNRLPQGIGIPEDMEDKIIVVPNPQSKDEFFQERIGIYLDQIVKAYRKKQIDETVKNTINNTDLCISFK